MASGDPGSSKFNSKTDSESHSAREAYRTAKDRNGVPRSQSPLEHPTKIVDGNNPDQFVTEYKHRNVYGESISIRKDNSIDYGDGSQKQGPHYNAGRTGEKFKQHHNYNVGNKK
ncbi:unnamed protein product [Rotaria sordida]|uniref:Uncharacterized protein n=1 Tax=Rotaria sordida TaxID=392033 RepID=A0A814NQL6_9BILA|nr:unnamed protein product [Rotaria sordida]CAF4027266.1 unnamed protein product [Rotaria sordida]